MVVVLLLYFTAPFHIYSTEYIRYCEVKSVGVKGRPATKSKIQLGVFNTKEVTVLSLRVLFGAKFGSNPWQILLIEFERAQCRFLEPASGLYALQSFIWNGTTALQKQDVGVPIHEPSFN